MIERPLMTPDELKSMPKGQFVVMKTGFYPMKVRLKLFFKWGIQFDEKHPYEIPDQGNRKVEYAAKKDIMDGIVKKYRPELLESPAPPEESGASGGPPDKDKRRSGGTAVQTSPRNRRSHQPAAVPEQEVKSDGQA